MNRGVMMVEGGNGHAHLCCVKIASSRAIS